MNLHGKIFRGLTLSANRTLIGIFAQAKWLIFLFFFFLTGCLTWDTLEVRVRPVSNSTGSMEVVLYPVGSDAQNSYGRRRDFSELIFDIVQNESFAAADLSAVRRNLRVKADRLQLNVQAGYHNLKSLEEFTEIELQSGRFIRELNRDEKLLETNAKVIRTEDRVVLSWAKTEKELFFKLKTRNTISSRKWKPGYSLMPEYSEYLQNAKPFRRTYIFSKTAEAGNYLREGDYDNAYIVLNLILQVAPGDPLAKEELRKIHRVRYLDLVRSFSAPTIFLTEGGRIDTERIKNWISDSLGRDSQGISVDQLYFEGVDALDQGEYPKALQIFDSILEEFPAHYPALASSLKARLLMPSSNPAEISRTIETLAVNRQRPGIVFLTAMARALAGDNAGAKKLIEQLATEKNVDFLPIRDALFWLEKDLDLDSR